MTEEDKATNVSCGETWMDQLDLQARRLPHLNERSCGGPRMGKGIVSEGSHLELPASLHTVPVASYDVQVVIQNHCSETPLISPERKLCNWVPVFTVF